MQKYQVDDGVVFVLKSLFAFTVAFVQTVELSLNLD